MQHGGKRRPDAELGVDQAIRIRDHREGQIGLVLAELIGRGVEQHDLTDPGIGDLLMATGHLTQMKTADRATREAPELKVHNGVRGGDRHIRAIDGRQRPRRDVVSDVEHNAPFNIESNDSIPIAISIE